MSHVALSTLTGLVPFPIFVTAVAGFLGSRDLSDEDVSNSFALGPNQVAEPLARDIIPRVLAQGPGGIATAGTVLAVYFASSRVEALAQCARTNVTTYAGLASVMIALLFLDMLAAIFSFGSELDAARLRARRGAD